MVFLFSVFVCGGGGGGGGVSGFKFSDSNHQLFICIVKFYRMYILIGVVWFIIHYALYLLNK